MGFGSQNSRFVESRCVLYKSLVHPFLENTAPAWNSNLAKTVLALEKVEQRAFRLAKTWGDGTRRSFKEAEVVYTRNM